MAQGSPLLVDDEMIIAFLGEVHNRIERLEMKLIKPPSPSVRAAMRFVQGFLRDRGRPGTKVLQAGAQAGHGQNSMYAAAKELGVEFRQHGWQAPNYWILPND